MMYITTCGILIVLVFFFGLFMGMVYSVVLIERVLSPAEYAEIRRRLCIRNTNKNLRR